MRTQILHREGNKFPLLRRYTQFWQRVCGTLRGPHY